MSYVQPLVRPGEEAGVPRPADHPLTSYDKRPALTQVQLEERSLICNSPVPTPDVNAFREMRTRLLAAGAGRSFVTLVCPVSSGSGGSFVCRNLAAAFAFDETKSAVLVDCNLYNPSQHSTMFIEPTRGGLVDYLCDPSSESSEIAYDTGVPRLRLIPTGSLDKRGGEFFTSPRMRLLLDALRNRSPSPYVFMDGPPVRGAPDSQILADHADLVVLVAGYGRDTPAAIQRAAAQFDPNKFAGVVLNQA